MDDSGGSAVGAIFGLCFAVFYIAIIAVVVAGVWKAFVKAGKPGWAAIVPIYNLIVMLEIARKPIWWVALFFVPLANLVVSILTSIEIAKAFGKSEGFGVGLALLAPVFWPILGFGSAQYTGGAGGGTMQGGGGWGGGMPGGGMPGGGFGGGQPGGGQPGWGGQQGGGQPGQF